MSGYPLYFISVIAPLYISKFLPNDSIIPLGWTAHKISTHHWKRLGRAVMYFAEGESSITVCSKSAPWSDKEVKRKVIEG